MSAIPITVSLELEPGATESITNALLQVLGSVGLSLLDETLGEGGAEFFEQHDSPMNGTDKLVIRLRFNAALFDTKLRATLRAKGFALDNNLVDHDNSLVGCDGIRASRPMGVKPASGGDA